MKKIILIIIAFIFLISINSVFSINNVSERSCYDLDEISGPVVDNFRQLKNMTNSNAKRGVSGVIGNAFEFDGSANNYTFRADDSDFDFGTDAFSVACWVNFQALGSAIIIHKQTDATGFQGWYLHQRGTTGKMAFETHGPPTSPIRIEADFTTDTNTDYHVVGVRNSSGDLAIYINGTLNNNGVNDGSQNVNSAGQMRIGQNNAGNQGLDGVVDMCVIYARALTDQDVADLYNGTKGIACSQILDTVLPIVSNLNQTPDNITTVNALQGVNITADVIDETALDDSTVKLEITYDNISIFVNGSLIIEPVIINFTNKTGDNFRFFIDETTYLSATYNYPETLLENTPHQNDTIDGLNSFLKIEFFNVSNDKEQVFYEIMDEEVTDQTTDYYYCNSSYSVGNPVSSSNCALFFQRTAGQSFNHTHTQFSRHRIIPLGINTNTGELNGVGVTPISFIIKRGTVGGERFYYINDSYRISAQTSGNNGNTWNDFIGTIDSHIHQFDSVPSEAIIYRVCGNDTSNNTGCSAFVTDIIDFVILPPSSVEILNPVADTYNITIIIEHTTGFSPTGQTIVGYQYDYKRVDLEDWVDIIENNFPLTNFTWDISNFLNADYQIRVIVTDELNLTSTTISEVFTIQNPLTVTEQLLTELLDETQTGNELKALILEVLEVLAFVFLIIIFLVLGVLVNYFFWWFSAILLWLLTIIDALNGTFTQDYATNIVYVLFGFALFFSAIYLEINRMQEQAEENNPKSMYDDFY